MNYCFDIRKTKILDICRMIAFKFNNDRTNLIKHLRRLISVNFMINRNYQNKFNKLISNIQSLLMEDFLYILSKKNILYRSIDKE